ncbi:MAG TPA: transporter substrate-binding domain-containing protein [Bdellovibrio sp.]|nr:transporter substrate-binding domain-containing protein [Bdellovibrio sp.]
MRCAFFFFISFVCFALSSYAEQAPSINAVVPDGMTAPLLMGTDDAPQGIVADYTRALLKIMGIKGHVSVITRYRILSYVQEGKVDFICYTSRAWADQKETFDWSKTLFMKREVILGPAPMPKKLIELDGKTLGTMLGYNYPNLDPLFKSKRIFREDASSEEATLNKLKNGRIQYAVTDEIFLDYYKSRNPAIEMNRERMFLQEYPVSCSLSRKGHVKVKDLNHAIDELKSSGQLKKIFESYGVKLNL